MKTEIYKILVELNKNEISVDHAESLIDSHIEQLFNSIKDYVTSMTDAHEGSLVGLSNNISQLHINQFIS